MLAPLHEREAAFPPAAVLLRSRARDGVAVIARDHRARREHAGLVLRREDARHRDLRAVDPDADRLIAGRAGPGARADPASGTAGDCDLQIVREGAAVLGGRAGVGALPQSVCPRLRRGGGGWSGGGDLRRLLRSGAGGGLRLGLLLVRLLLRLLELRLLLVEARDRRGGHLLQG